MHIFLTGGTGFFGRALLRTVRQRADSGNPVPLLTILTRSPAAFAEAFPEFCGLPWLHIHGGDICRPETLPSQSHFSHILHAAADSTLGPRLTPMQRYDQIVEGTRNLLDFAVTRGAKRFLLTSSGGVYGVQPEHLERMHEDWHGMPDPLNPANAYSIGKRAAEHLCALYHQQFGVETVIARCFSFVGQDLPLDAHFAIGNFIRDALWGDEILVAGDGMPRRSYLDQQDLASWLLTMLETGQANRAYNVGSDEAISISDLATMVRDILCPGKPIRTLGKSGGSINRNIYVPDVTRARTELGVDITIPLADAIGAAAAHLGGKTRA